MAPGTCATRVWDSEIGCFGSPCEPLRKTRMQWAPRSHRIGTLRNRRPSAPPPLCYAKMNFANVSPPGTRDPKGQSVDQEED